MTEMKNSIKVWLYREENEAKSKKPRILQSDSKKFRGLIRRSDILK